MAAAAVWRRFNSGNKWSLAVDILLMAARHEQTTGHNGWRHITNNDVVPVHQAGGEELLGNAVRRVWRAKNRTNIESATFHLAAD